MTIKNVLFCTDNDVTRYCETVPAKVLRVNKTIEMVRVHFNDSMFWCHYIQVYSPMDAPQLLPWNGKICLHLPVHPLRATLGEL